MWTDAGSLVGPRHEDAVSATRAAIEEGIVAGGGSALIHAAKVLDGDLGLSGDEKAGYVITSKVAQLEPGHGYNARTGVYENLVDAGVIDPVKVTRSALANAASIASLLLTTETLVVEKKDEEDDK